MARTVAAAFKFTSAGLHLPPFLRPADAPISPHELSFLGPAPGRGAVPARLFSGRATGRARRINGCRRPATPASDEPDGFSRHQRRRPAGQIRSRLAETTGRNPSRHARNHGTAAGKTEALSS